MWYPNAVVPCKYGANAIVDIAARDCHLCTSGNVSPLVLPEEESVPSGPRIVFFFVVFCCFIWILLHLSLLVEFDGLLQLVEAGSVTIHVHEHLVALLASGSLALHVFHLGPASVLGHVKVCLDTVTDDDDSRCGLDPAWAHSPLGTKMGDDVGVDSGGSGEGLTRNAHHGDGVGRRSVGRD